MSKPLILFAFCILGIAQTGFTQVNVVLLHQLVSNSESEYDRQTKARTAQATVTANEDVNRSKMTTLKTTYRKIYDRFHTLGLVINVAQIGIEATPIINDIIRQQQLTVNQCRDKPILIALAAGAEIDLVNQAELLTDYCAGLILTIGDVNQMKANDRKMLFSYVITELRRINGASIGLLTTITNYNLHSRSDNPFSSFINQDKNLVDEIVRNAGALKK
ncbi:hypothetical protein [Mucilaginibacter lacusdianchii]|uniref:hypothetical protein n=1 Tax=Mucilaginibacter lacusdianchii TaxID=2684211 RepID=UPI00131E755D|nr:hypothetical protein [Mucilaginibacter sp. JXJ CY 39]